MCSAGHGGAIAVNAVKEAIDIAGATVETAMSAEHQGAVCVLEKTAL